MRTQPRPAHAAVALPSPSPLCPELYRALAMRIPHGGAVLVANQGEAISGYPGYDTTTGERKFIVTSWGETYRVNCPFCRDTRRRLWVNHMYGQPDPVNAARVGDFYGICFNDDCLKSAENRRQLWEMIYGFRNRQAFAPPQLDLTNVVREDGRIIERPLPGVTEPLLQLPPTAPAREYLASRRFGDAVAVKYGLRYCHQGGDYPMAAGRIIAPITMYGQLIGWQGRYVGTPPSKMVPKYYTCPGMPKRRVLYNYDNAVGKPFVVVFEGVTDVWRLGDCSVALLGKTLTTQQRQLLEGGWQRREPIIFCLDPDAAVESALAIRELATRGSNPVVAVQLPAGWDPAEYEIGPLWAVIRTQAAARGVVLPTTM